MTALKNVATLVVLVATLLLLVATSKAPDPCEGTHPGSSMSFRFVSTCGEPADVRVTLQENSCSLKFAVADAGRSTTGASLGMATLAGADWEMGMVFDGGVRTDGGAPILQPATCTVSRATTVSCTGTLQTTECDDEGDGGCAPVEFFGTVAPWSCSGTLTQQ